MKRRGSSAHGPGRRWFAWPLAVVIAATPTVAGARHVDLAPPAQDDVASDEDAPERPGETEVDAPDEAEPGDGEPDAEDEAEDGDGEPDAEDGEAEPGEPEAEDGEAGDDEPGADDDEAEPEADEAEPEAGETADVADDGELQAGETAEDGDGEAVDGETTMPGVPERLPKMQIAAWWTLFGAFALASTAGVFSGLAERQEDKATRLASRFDQDTGSQPLYADVRGDYEDALSRGRAYQNTAIALGAVAGAVAIAAITLFIVDVRRGKRSRQRARLAPGGLQVRF